MIGQLCSGTLLNPTVSVTAPPGMRFYNASPKPVPIVYGNAFVEGEIISDIYAQEEQRLYPGTSTHIYKIALWQAICCGKIKLNAILFDSKLKVFNYGSLYGQPYDPNYFNNGDPDVFQNEFPPLVDRGIPSGGSLVLPYLAPLHGIAHYYFNTDNGAPTDLTSKVPKIQYDVTRMLNTGLSIHGDDIPFPVIETTAVSNYSTFGCSFISGTTIHVACPQGFFPVNSRIIFHAPTTWTLPPNITAEQSYWVVISNWSSGGGYMSIAVSATQGGSAITVGTYRPATCSLVLSPNAGNNPASVIWDLLTNQFYGLGFSSDLTSANPDINVVSFQNVLEFFYASTTKPYGVNCSFQDKTPAKDMIKKICEWTDCILTTDNNGKFYLTVNDPTRITTQGRIGRITLSSKVNLDLNGVPLLVTDDFVDFKPTFKTYDDTLNEFHGKFISFADSYANLQVFFRNEANIATTGSTRSKDFDLSCLIFPNTVSARLLEIAKRESFPLITISSVCKIGLITALVNDIWRITHTEYGIDDYFKITKKTITELEAGQVKIEWTQCPELMFDQYSTGISSASASVPSVVIPGGSVVVENLTFPAGTSLSTARTNAYTTDSTSIVVWGVGQENSGTLVYDSDPGFANNGDYTIVTHNKIQLNPTKFANTIQANMLGLLNVDTY